MEKDKDQSMDSIAYKLLVTIPFVVGAAGNIAALWILYRSARKRNAKHVLLLRCLAANDLVSQIGMLALFYLQHYNLVPVHTRCVLYVLVRAFGLGSGCVAFIMAVERWLALTKPFFYQQYVTYQILKRSMFTLWLSAIFLTYLPLFGLGLYYENDCCRRYREAKKKEDIAYAYLFFTFAYCNTMVFWALSRIGTQKKVLVRRISRSTMNRVGKCGQYATAEELAFAKVMAFLCIIFVTCWMPQMVLIPLAQSNYTGKPYRILSRVADVLMCVYFTIDPYVYVLQQYMEKSRFKIPFSTRRSTSLQASTPTTTPSTILLDPLTFFPSSA